MTEPRTRSWMPPIPAPLQRLFDQFPLATYPPNELPARSPRPSSLATLYVFASDEDAAAGRPSFNPSCLKWQTFLRLANIPHHLSASTNHASPTGSLPFLLPPTPSPVASSSPSPPPRPIPSTNLERYALTTNPSSATESITPTSALPPQTLLRQEPYLSLLNGPVRAAWLAALYLDRANAALLRSLYVAPCSTSPLVRAALQSQLRAAAEAEVVRILAPTTAGSGGWRVTVNSLLEFGPGAKQTPAAVIDPEEIFAEAGRAFESLASLLAESESGWFFGVERPGLFDAAVFAYTWLAAVDDGRGEGMGWRDGGRLEGLVRGAGRGELVAHRERVWEVCWGGRRAEKAGLDGE